MEVHHHPHVEKKGLKEYFLEFAMIFLAVTLGFFAENIREHFANSEKEKGYMESMVQDLKRDTAALNSTISFQKTIYNKIDSALKIPVEELSHIEAQDSFYHFFVYFYSWVAAFTRIDNTVTQLKNAGGFSLLQNKQVKDSITELNSFYERELELDKNIYTGRWQRIDEFAMQLIILPKAPSDINDPLYSVHPHHVELFTRYDKPLLQQLYSFIRFEQSDIEINLYDENRYNKMVTNLIKLIKQNYNIENE
jgi:hypothetical protein